MVNTFLCTYVSHLGAGVHMAAVTVYKQIRVKGSHTFHGPPHCFLSPSLLPQLERDEFSCNTQPPEEHLSLYI